MWRREASAEDIAYATEYLGLSEKEGFSWGILRGGLGSVADMFVAQMQDYLGLGTGHRMNTPGIPDGNWQWRMVEGEASPELAAKIRRMCENYDRCEKQPAVMEEEQTEAE